MPTYGTQTGGTPGGYDGTAAYAPTTPEWLQWILNQLGGIVDQQRKEYQMLQSPFWQQALNGVSWLGNVLTTEGAPEFGLPFSSAATLGQELSQNGGIASWLNRLYALTHLEPGGDTAHPEGYLPQLLEDTDSISVQTTQLVDVGTQLLGSDIERIAQAVIHEEFPTWSPVYGYVLTDIGSMLTQMDMWFSWEKLNFGTPSHQSPYFNVIATIFPNTNGMRAT